MTTQEIDQLDIIAANTPENRARAVQIHSLLKSLQEYNAPIKADIDSKVAAYRAQLEAACPTLAHEKEALTHWEALSGRLRDAWVSYWQLSGKPDGGKTSPDSLLQVRVTPGVVIRDLAQVVKFCKAKLPTVVIETVDERKLKDAVLRGIVENVPGLERDDKYTGVIYPEKYKPE